MNVSRENRREFGRDVATADDVGSACEYEIARTDRGTLDAMVNTEQSVIGRVTPPARLIGEAHELGSNVVALIGKARQCDACSADVDDESSRRIEDPNVSVGE